MAGAERLVCTRSGFVAPTSGADAAPLTKKAYIPADTKTKALAPAAAIPINKAGSRPSDGGGGGCMVELAQTTCELTIHHPSASHVAFVVFVHVPSAQQTRPYRQSLVIV